MYNEFGGTLSNLALAKHRKSRAINAENPKGEKGKGGMAASHLGPSRKGSPCLNDIASGQTVTLAEIEETWRDQSYLDHSGCENHRRRLLCTERSGSSYVLG